MPPRAYHLAALAPLSLAACTTLGERASTGACPAGETCSPATPVGLAFTGPTLADLPFDSGLHPTAAGGTQTIVVHDAGSGARLAQPFRATIHAPFAIDAVDAARASVRVRAEAAGTGSLRVTAPDGALYDVLAVRALTGTSIGLRSATETLRADLGIAAAPGRAVPVVITLSGSGARLVDEGLALTVDGTPAPDATWQTATLTAPATGAIELVATTSAGERRAFALTAAAAIDRLELHAHDPLVVNQGGVVCGAAIAGDAQVLGETWAWTSAGAELLGGLGQRNCVGVVPSQVGPLTLVATAGSATATFTVDVVAAAQRTAPTAPAPAETGLGERATLALDAE